MANSSSSTEMYGACNDDAVEAYVPNVFPHHDSCDRLESSVSEETISASFVINETLETLIRMPIVYMRGSLNWMGKRSLSLHCSTARATFSKRLDNRIPAKVSSRSDNNNNKK